MEIRRKMIRKRKKRKTKSVPNLKIKKVKRVNQRASTRNAESSIVKILKIKSLQVAVVALIRQPNGQSEIVKLIMDPPRNSPMVVINGKADLLNFMILTIQLITF